MKHTTLLLLTAFLFSGCSQLQSFTPFNPSASLSADTPVSGYYLLHNDSQYDGIEETDTTDVYKAHYDVIGGSRRAQFLADNFCAEQGMEQKVTNIDVGTKSFLFRCHNKQNKKLPKVALPEKETLHRSQPETVKAYAKNEGLIFATATGDSMLYYDQIRVKPESDARPVKLITFNLEKNERYEHGIVLMCNKNTYDSIVHWVYSPIFGKKLSALSEDRQQRKVNPNSLIAKIRSQVCRDYHQKNSSPTHTVEKTITRTRN